MSRKLKWPMSQSTMLVQLMPKGTLKYQTEGACRINKFENPLPQVRAGPNMYQGLSQHTCKRFHLSSCILRTPTVSPWPVESTIIALIGSASCIRRICNKCQKHTHRYQSLQKRYNDTLTESDDYCLSKHMQVGIKRSRTTAWRNLDIRYSENLLLWFIHLLYMRLSKCDGSLYNPRCLEPTCL